MRPHRVTVVRYYLGPRRVPKGTPGAVPRAEQTAAYYATLGRKRVPLGTSDLATAEERLRQLLEHGDDPARAYRKTPLSQHAEAYSAYLQGKGVTDKHREQVLHSLEWLAEAAGWQKLADLTAEGLESVLAQMRGLGKSARTRRDYLQHARQFASWCVRRKRLASNPFAGLESPNSEADRRLIHRDPTPEELGKLFAYLERGPQRRGMPACCRACGYRVCLGTGLRAGELRQLERPWFHLERATLSLPGRVGKNRRPVLQPLPPWLVEQLRGYFPGPTWERFPAHDPGQVLSEDLVAAGVPLILPGPEAPEHFTFHSFRVHFITELCRDPQNTLKTVMELARHSDPKLTLRIYAKFHAEDGKGALERLRPAP